MKTNNFIIIITFFSIVISETCFAENNYNISFVDEPTYELVRTIRKNNEIIAKSYLIYILLHNSGPEKSEELRVNISDEEGFDLFQKVYVEPGETTVVTFNWSTLLLKNQKITVNFFVINLIKSIISMSFQFLSMNAREHY